MTRKKGFIIAMSLCTMAVVTIVAISAGNSSVRSNAAVPSHWEHYWSAYYPPSEAYHVWRNLSTNGETHIEGNMVYYQEHFAQHAYVEDYVVVSIKAGYSLSPEFSYPQLYANGILMELYGHDTYYGLYEYQVHLPVSHVEYTVLGILDGDGNPVEPPTETTCQCTCPACS